MKFGGEFIRYTMPQSWSNIGTGQFTINAAPPANIEQLLAGVGRCVDVESERPVVRSIRDFTVSIGDFSYALKRQIYAAWFQDDWRMGNRLTANLGVRWDVDRGSHGEWIRFEPWLSGTRPTEMDNFAPRLGFAYSATDRTVIRGGYGIFFTELEDDALHQSHILTEHMAITVVNDGRAGFRLQSVQRAEADLRPAALPGPATRRRRPRTSPRGRRGLHRRGAVPAAVGHDRDPVRRARHVVQPHGVDRRAAAVRRADGARVEFRVHRRPQGRAPVQRESRLQPGDRRQLSVHG